MDHESARALLHDLAARTLVAAYIEEDGGRSLAKVDPVTGEPTVETEPGEVVRAVIQWHGAGWAGEIAAGWHCFIDDRYVFMPGARADLLRAVDGALAMVDEANDRTPDETGILSAPGHLGGQLAAGDLRLANVVVDVQDMERAVSFWSAALGYRSHERHPEFTMLVDPDGRGLPLSLQAAEEPPKEPVRLHLDLYTGDQAGQVDRLVQLGATTGPDWPHPQDADFVVLRDPDGNEFCVIDHAEP